VATQKNVLLVVVFALPLFVTASLRIFPESLRSHFFSVTKPFLSASQSLSRSVAGTFTGLRRFLLVYQENDKLRKETDLLEKEVIMLREKEQENTRLRSLLDFKTKTPSRAIACQIIARDVTHLSNWAVLDKGSRHGIKEQMPVVNEQGLVGKVVEVGAQTARIILLTDVESKVSGIVQNSRDTGLVTGDGSPFLRMKFIDLDSDIKIGNVVLSSGLGGVYPKGIPIGKVESVGREKNGLQLYSRIKPIVSFSKIEEVLCLDYPVEN